MATVFPAGSQGWARIQADLALERRERLLNAAVLVFVAAAGVWAWFLPAVQP